MIPCSSFQFKLEPRAFPASHLISWTAKRLLWVSVQLLRSLAAVGQMCYDKRFCRHDSGCRPSIAAPDLLHSRVVWSKQSSQNVSPLVFMGVSENGRTGRGHQTNTPIPWTRGFTVFLHLPLRLLLLHRIGSTPGFLNRMHTCQGESI